MCVRKIFIHHRCGHKITELAEACGEDGCRAVHAASVVTNKYPCVCPGCVYYGQF
jgi:hypothetical protein